MGAGGPSPERIGDLCQPSSTEAALRDVVHPRLHQRSRPLEQIGSQVGRFDPVRVKVANRELADLSRRVRALGAPITKAAPCSRNSFERMLSDSGRPVTLGRIKPEPSAHSRASAKIYTARSLSGTRCSRSIFILSAGTIDVAVSRSTSSHHRAFLTSPERDAVRTTFSRAATAAECAREARTVARAFATSVCGSA